MDLVEQIVDELKFVGDLGSTEDGEERLLGALEDLGEEFELLLHEESDGLLGQIDTDHGRMSAVGGSEGVVDEDISELGERSAERFDGLGIRFRFLAFGIFRRSFFRRVESQIFEKDDFAVFGFSDVIFGRFANAVVEEGDGFLEQGREFVRDGFEGEFLDDVTVRSTEVRHEDHSGGSLLESVVDRRYRSENSLSFSYNFVRNVLSYIMHDACNTLGRERTDLVVGDFAFSIERDVKVYSAHGEGARVSTEWLYASRAGEAAYRMSTFLPLSERSLMESFEERDLIILTQRRHCTIPQRDLHDYERWGSERSDSDFTPSRRR